MPVAADRLEWLLYWRNPMSCLQVHDFIAGTTIALPRGKPRAAAGGRLDIVRPNGVAAALVADHLARLSALGAVGGAKRRAARRAA
jgi:hypothetical protein